MAGWDAIVCTCQNRESAHSFRKELKIRQKKGLISSQAILLAVDDPKPNIGSGSAALNALLCVAERLAALQGRKIVTGDVLKNSRVLILLLGTTFPFSPCGHAFMPHPCSSQTLTPTRSKEESGVGHTELKANIDHLLGVLAKLSPNPPPGVWVCSTDMLLTVPTDFGPTDISAFQNTVAVFTLRSTPEHAMLHGACRITQSGEFAQIVHMGGKDLIQSFVHGDGSCDMLSGIVYLGPKVAERLLELHTRPPLDACTYIGLDNGAKPLSLSLFFDILLCMTTDIDKKAYVEGAFKHVQETSPALSPLMKRAREKLWEALYGTQMKAVPLEGAEHHYLQYTATDVLARYHAKGRVPTPACVINSLIHPEAQLEDGSVIINCQLKTPISVGKGCFLSGLGDSFAELQATRYMFLPQTVPDGLTMQEIHIALGQGHTRTSHSVVVTYGVRDRINCEYVEGVSGEAAATFCNKPWGELFKRTGIEASDLWLPGAPKTLFHAKLYVAAHTSADVGIKETMWLIWNGQDSETLDRWRSSWRVSLWDILTCVDCNSEFSKMRGINFELQKNTVMTALKENAPVCFLSFFRASLIERRQYEILSMLDQVVQEVHSNPLIVCRVYACIADMLGYMAGEAGIRAGPAANLSWQMAFALLEEGKLLEATKALAAERAHWIEESSGPDRIIRASRHYEKAGQILTRQAVATAKEYIKGSPCKPPAIGQTVTARGPSRVDLAGGWTDTPPIAYEWGGAVATLAVKINNECPIKAIAERLEEPKLVIVQWSNQQTELENITLTKLSHLSDYSQPHAPGALLKAAFICAGVVQYPSSIPLDQQLKERFGCGFKLQSFSNVPQGSGLGTSSILGGCILTALYRAMGEEHTHSSLIHAILHLEQLLTTGGGWQDQCGGLYGGAKLSRSEKGLPVNISTKQLTPPPNFTQELSDRLMLIYTGKTRLARNLLQDVIRNWHSREATIVQTVSDLVENAEKAAVAIETGDIAELGACLTRYQSHKLAMAPGSVPDVVSLFTEKAMEYIYGSTLCGAGGGGFMVAIVKDPTHKQVLSQLISETAELSSFVVYEAAIDDNGLQIDM